MSHCWVYITNSNKAEALKIAHKLVQEKLIACANIYDNITSVYEWEGKLEESQEAVLIAKTRTELFGKVKESVTKIHSYSCPCIVSLPIQDGSKSFLDWIDKQVKHKGAV